MASSSVEPSPSSSFKGSPQNPQSQDVFQSVVKGRKIWKTRQDGEAVWPPELDAALIEGLENYRPDDSRETRLLGRFPMRNRFISDWIFQRTGKRRTAKQVGSRLQQLRDTDGNDKVSNMLSSRRPGSTRFLSPESSSLEKPTEAHATLQNLLYRGVEPRMEETPDTIVYIDLLPKGFPIDNTETTDTSLATSGASSPSQVADERSWVESGHKVVRASERPHRLQDIDPTVTIVSQTKTSALSHYTVFTEEGAVFSESTVLEPFYPSTPTSNDKFLYKTSLVPGFWETISQSPDASQYLIVQRVVEDTSPSSPPSPTIFSAMYRFNYTSSSHTEPTDSTPTMISLNPVLQPLEFSFDAPDAEGSFDWMALQNSSYPIDSIGSDSDTENPPDSMRVQILTNFFDLNQSIKVE